MRVHYHPLPLFLLRVLGFSGEVGLVSGFIGFRSKQVT